jgi:hypothetical protein
MGSLGKVVVGRSRGGRPTLPRTRALWTLVFPLVFSLLGLFAAPAFAGTAEEINLLPTLDSLNRSEAVLSNSSKWSALAWDSSTTGHSTGQDTTGGWGPYDAFSTVNGAFWSPSTFADKTGDAATVTMQTSPGGAERYVALWLNMASPGSAMTGYQLRWTVVSGTTYNVILSKYSAGTQTVLASNSAVTIPTGATLAISDTGGTVTAWQGSGGSLASILSASDSTFTSGYAGIEASGNISRSINFKAGNLSGGGSAPPDTSISSGPKGIVVPNLSFGFTSTEAGSSFECSLDGAAYSTCISPKAYQGLAEGSRIFRVRATGAGGKDETPAERGFQVVQTAKATAKTPLLDNLERQEVPLATGKWSKSSWAAEIGGAWMGGYRGYGSGGGLAGAYWNQTTFSDGEGTALVAGTVGTGSVPSGQYSALLLNMPNPSGARSGYEARFSGTGSATNYTVELAKWVSGVRTVLASTTGFSLPVGTTIALTETAGGSLALWTGTTSLSAVLSASDSTYTSGYAGLEVNGGAGTVYNFRAGRIDIQPPDTTITSGPTGTVPPANVSFGFTASESGSSFECSLDGAAYSSCSSPKVYPTIASGAHTFRVRATDAVGNQDSTPAERSFQVLQPPTAATAPATGVGASTATLKANVNPNGGETTYQFEYGTTTSYGTKVPASAKAIGAGSANVEVGEAIGGLSAGTIYHFRISAANAAGTSKGEDRTFTTAAAPVVTTEAATAVSGGGATLNGTINPKGAETTYQFDYGTTTAYGAKVPASAKSVGPGTSGVVVSQTPAGLAEGTTYHYRVVASNSVGTTYGQDLTFTTLILPDAETEAAEPVDANAAILEGTVDPNGSEASYRFQYGQTTSYGQESAVGYEALEEPDEESELVEPLVRLKPGTTYHYRLVATSAAGIDYGADKTVTTGPAQIPTEQEEIQEQEKLNYTARLTPPPGTDFAGLHQHGEFKFAQARNAPMNAAMHSGAGWLRVMVSGQVPDATLEDIFAKATNRGLRLLPYIPTQQVPTAAQEEVAVQYVRDSIKKYGPGGTFWSKAQTASGVPLNNKMAPVTWELGNEPNRGEGSSQVNPKKFGAFFARMSAAARETANVQVLLAGLYSASQTKNDPECRECVMTVSDWINEMDHEDAYDAISLHPYAFKVEKKAPTKETKNALMKSIEGKIAEAWNVLKHTGQGGKKIWITEFGFPTDYGGSKEQEKEIPPVTPAVQQELIEAFFNLAKAVRTERDIAHIFYFNLQEYIDPSPGAPAHAWPYAAGLRYMGGKNKPGWEGFAKEANGHPWWPRKPNPKKPLTRLIRPRAADVAAAVDTDGADAAYYFRYRKKSTTEWTSSTSASGTTQAIEGDQDVEGTITNLSPETDYEYQVVVTNENEATEVSPVQELKTGSMSETTATVTDELNGEPGWASVAGWSKYDGVGLDGLKVRVNFLKSDGTYVFRDATLVYGQYHVDNVPLGRGTWETWSVFLAQGGYPESPSGYHQIKIKNGYKLIAKHSTKCLDVNGGVIGNGAPMIQYKCEDPQGALNQIFTLVPTDDQHHYQLIARHSNRCVGVTAGSQQPGVQLSQYDCLGPAYTHQIWKSEGVLPNGPENSYNRFVAQNSGQCMEVRESSGADGGIVDQYPCAGTQANQLWTFESVEGNQVPTQTFLTIDKNDTYHGMPGYISFHGRLDIAGRAYPLAGRIVHVIFERQNAQGGFEPVPGEEYNATLNSAGEYTYRYWGIGRDTWHIRAAFYGTGDALGKSESETHTEEIKSGYRLMFRSSQKCLSTSNNGTANGTWLIQWTCDPNWNPWDGQTFSLYPVAPIGSNHWQLRPNTAYGQCVDVYGASTANGAPLNLYQCTPGAANQVWSFPELGSPNNGWFGGVALHSNKCMDVTAGNPNNGVQIEQYDCIWNGNQQFAWQVVP